MSVVQKDKSFLGTLVFIASKTWYSLPSTNISCLHLRSRIVPLNCLSHVHIPWFVGEFVRIVTLFGVFTLG